MHPRTLLRALAGRGGLWVRSPVVGGRRAGHFLNGHGRNGGMRAAASMSTVDSTVVDYRARARVHFGVKDLKGFAHTFREMCDKGIADTAACNMALQASVELKDVESARAVWGFMESTGIQLNATTCDKYVRACLTAVDPAAAVDALEHVLEKGRRVPGGDVLFGAALKQLLSGPTASAENVALANKVFGMMQRKAPVQKGQHPKRRDVGLRAVGGVLKLHALNEDIDALQTLWKRQVALFHHLDSNPRKKGYQNSNLNVRVAQRWLVVRDYLQALNIYLRTVHVDGEEKKMYVADIEGALMLGLDCGVTVDAVVPQAFLQGMHAMERLGQLDAVARGIMLFQTLEKAMASVGSSPHTVALNKYLSLVHRFSSFQKDGQTTVQLLREKGLFDLEPMGRHSTTVGPDGASPFALQPGFLSELNMFLLENPKRYIFDILHNAGRPNKSPYRTSPDTSTFNFCLKILNNHLHSSNNALHGELWKERWDNYLEDYTRYAVDIKKRMEQNKDTLPDTTTYNNLLEICGSTPFGMKLASKLYVEMLNKQIKRNEHTHTKMLRALSRRMQYYQWELTRGYVPKIKTDEFKIYFMMLSQKIKEDGLSETGAVPIFLSTAKQELQGCVDSVVVVGNKEERRGVLRRMKVADKAVGGDTEDEEEDDPLTIKLIER